MEGLASVERPTIIQKQEQALAPLVVAAVLFVTIAARSVSTIVWNSSSVMPGMRTSHSGFSPAQREYDVQIANSADVDETG